MDGETKLFLAICVCVVLAMGGCATGCVPEYSVGERTGVVTKMSLRGLLWKTNDGNMNLGGVTNGSNGSVVPNVFEFTATDPKIIEDIKAASRGGYRVTVSYRQWGVKPIWLGDDSIITKVDRDTP